MTRLINIIYEKGIVKLQYMPEECGEYGIIEYDIPRDQLIKLQQTEWDKDTTLYVSGIIYWILSIIESEKSFPKEYTLRMF